ncbi:hypothetical protein Afil01_25540 [Actinorhabdospora filicis]|uniref:DUF3558 domain-containing protein n=1 Tax=Actinorhabdospora filicis TaxID=1785913 RepID=A0A9W6SL11_9ACTN|nr:hypothetical protein [Actinorhabdospora filicis]GLZ77747.1 hypothetical protein Afil01_25540 [Actinorhabdospora filicis]
MRRRATALLALSFALALTGCGSSTPSTEDVALTGASAIGQALPTVTSLPAGWERDSQSGKPRTAEGEEAAGTCRKNLDTSCTGLSALGAAHFQRADDPQSTVVYTLMAFDTPGNADVVIKAIAADRHADSGDPERKLTVDAGSDTTEAFETGGETNVIMRAGAVVIWLQGYLPPGTDLAALAKVAVERVTKVADGKNPDGA